MQQSAPCESSQTETEATGATNAPITSRTVSTFANRNMTGLINNSHYEVNSANIRAGKIAFKRLSPPEAV